jgi:hypothetical protein
VLVGLLQHAHRPSARARPTVSRRSLRSTPFGAPGRDRELVQAGDEPAEAELVAERSVATPTTRPSLRLGDADEKAAVGDRPPEGLRERDRLGVVADLLSSDSTATPS